MAVHEYAFDFSPRLIRYLGEELIQDKIIAVAELIKNSYDADASQVTLTVAKDSLIIEDDGYGMDTRVIREHWLKPGNSSHNGGNHRTPRYQRLPIGEKGIGRLGVHKLGDELTVISKMQDKRELTLNIKWQQLDTAESTEELPSIQVEELDSPKHFKHTTGTRIIINRLKEQFNDREIQQLNTDLIKMLPPFPSTVKDNFKITLRQENGHELPDTEEQLDTECITSKAIFKFKATIRKGEIQEFSYDFISPNPEIYPSHNINHKNSKKDLQLAIDKIKAIHNQENPITPQDLGPVVFQGYIFDARFSKLLLQEYDEQLTSYLKANGGIRVYRDGMRIYNYGEGGRDNDIIDLDDRRANHKNYNIGFNQLLAIIDMQRATSKKLTEKTNREGFIHNEPFFSLQRDLDVCMDLILHYRKLDMIKLDAIFNKSQKMKAPTELRGSLLKLADKFNAQAKQKDREDLIAQIHKESDKHEFRHNALLTSANTGLNVAFITHEMDKMVDGAIEHIEDNNVKGTRHTLGHLSKSIDMYRDIIRVDRIKEPVSVNSMVEQAVFYSGYLFEVEGITVTQSIEADLAVPVRKGLIVGTLLNIFDNAVYWLDHYQIKHKKICIRAYKENDDAIILIADNGMGFTDIDFTTALRPYVSGRILAKNIGIGLYLAEQVMLYHNGNIEQGTAKQDSLPKEFTNGAIIKLRFRGK